MAGKAKKDQAKANTAALHNLHLGSLILNTLFILFSLFFRTRSLMAYFVLSIPAFVSQYVLETSGRPKYTVEQSRSTLKSAGEDLGAQGLTEYLFDTVWVTWACMVLVMIVGDKAWWLFSIVPAFGLYKGWGLLGAARGMMGAKNAQAQGQEQQVPMNRKQRRMAA
jgi:hypothetical protein